MSGNDKADALDTCFDFIPLPFGDAPVEFCMALPRSAALDGGTEELPIPVAALPQSGRIASGRGFTAHQALASCRGELAELIGSCSWDAAKLIKASYLDLGKDAIHPNSILGFSEEQYARRDEWNAEHGDYDFVPEKFDEDRLVEWVEVKSFDGEQARFIPAALAYIGYAEKTDAGVFAVGDSNGCAAGSSYEAALESAFLELVERDATGHWWYGQRICPRVDLASIESGPVKDLVDWCTDRERSLQLIDITNDLQIPVFAAVSAEPDGSHVYMGFGAGFDAYRALGAALTEMLQIELSGQTAELFGPPRSPDEPPTTLQKWHARVSLHNQPHLSSGSPQRPLAYRFHGINDGNAAFFDFAQLTPWVVSNSLQGIDTLTVRTFIPGFSHYHARLGSQRLQMQLGEVTWLESSLSDSDSIFTPIAI